MTLALVANANRCNLIAEEQTKQKLHVVTWRKENLAPINASVINMEKFAANQLCPALHTHNVPQPYTFRKGYPCEEGGTLAKCVACWTPQPFLAVRYSACSIFRLACLIFPLIRLPWEWCRRCRGFVQVDETLRLSLALSRARAHHF